MRCLENLRKNCNTLNVFKTYAKETQLISCSNLIPLVKEPPINIPGRKFKLSNDESNRENCVLKEAHRAV